MMENSRKRFGKRALTKASVAFLSVVFSARRTTALSSSSPNKSSLTTRPLVLVCNGQGFQWNGMGQDLLNDSTIFRDTIDNLQFETGVPLLDYYRDDNHQWTSKEFSALGIVSFQLGLWNILREDYGIRIDSFSGVMGHSLGELACAHLTGCLPNPSDIIRCAEVRSKLVTQVIDPEYQLNKISLEHIDSLPLHHEMVYRSEDYAVTKTPRTVKVKANVSVDQSWSMSGKMAVVGAEAEQIHQAIASLKLKETVVGCYNSKRGQTVSGAAHEVDELVDHIKTEHGNYLFIREVDTDGIPYHAPLFRPLEDYLFGEFHELLPHISNKEVAWPGNWIATSTDSSSVHPPKSFGTQYLVDNLVEGVYFYPNLMKNVPKNAILMELGPSCGLLSPKQFSEFEIVSAMTSRGHGNTLESIAKSMQELDKLLLKAPISS